VSKLDANYTFIEPDGNSASDKLMVLEWNWVILYPAGTPAQQLIYSAKLQIPEGWKFGTSLLSRTRRAIGSASSPRHWICWWTRR